MKEPVSLDVLTAPQVGWYASSDGSYFEVGPCETREQAIQAAWHDELGWHEPDDPDTGELLPPVCAFTVAQCTVQPIALSSCFDANDWFEDLKERVAPDMTVEDGEVFVASKDQLAALTAKVQAAIDAWQSEQGWQCLGNTFSKMEHTEEVTLTKAPGGAS